MEWLLHEYCVSHSANVCGSVSESVKEASEQGNKSSLTHVPSKSVTSPRNAEELGILRKPEVLPISVWKQPSFPRPVKQPPECPREKLTEL